VSMQASVTGNDAQSILNAYKQTYLRVLSTFTVE